MAAMETQMIQQAYLFALDPTQAQAATLASHAGARRYAFNWAHAMIAAAADARQAQKDAGLEPDIAIPGQFEVGPAWTRWRDAAVGCKTCRRLLARDPAVPASLWADSRTGEITCDPGALQRLGLDYGAPPLHDPADVGCRRCWKVLRETPAGEWADSSGSAACPEARRPGPPHEPSGTCQDGCDGAARACGGPHEPSSDFLAWTGDVFSGTIQAAQRDADVAWKKFLSGKARRPRFKKRGKSAESFQVHGDGLKMDGPTRIVMPKIGAVTVMSDDSMHPAMRRSRSRAGAGRRHMGNRRRSRSLRKHLARSGPKAAALAPLLRRAREDAGLTPAAALAALNFEAGIYAAEAKAVRAVRAAKQEQQLLDMLDAEERTLPVPVPGAPQAEFAAIEGIAARRKKTQARLRSAQKRAGESPDAEALRTAAWTAPKLAALEKTGDTAGLAQLEVAAIFCAAYLVTGPLRDRVTGLFAQARITRATVTLGADGLWWCSAGAEIPMEIRTRPSRRQREGGVIGLDFGVREIATASNGVRIPNPRHYETALAELRAAQKQLSRSAPGSKRREKDKRAAGLIHADVARLRADAIHRATTVLVRQHDVIAIEGWNVQQVMRDGSRNLPRQVRRRRNRALADTGIGIGRQQLTYKGPRNGAVIMITSPDARTGTTCSVDGKARTTPLPPDQEMFTSDRCGHTLDRRLNTALAVQAWAVQELKRGPSPGGPAKPRGGDVRPGTSRARQSPGKRAATSSRPRRGETGTPGG